MNHLILITFVFVLQAAFSSPQMRIGAQDTIITLQNQVTTIISELIRSKRDFSFNLSQKLSREAINTMQQLNDITNPVLARIKTDVQNANEEGKDADSCYETAREGLSTASKNGFKEIDQCKVDSSSVVKPYLDSIDNTIKTGNDLKPQLTKILLNCISGDYWAQQNCILAQLPAASASVNLLKRTSGQLQGDSYSYINQAMAAAYPCFSQARSKVLETSFSIQRAASNCIKNL